MATRVIVSPRLRELEKIVDRDQAAFVRVGSALAEIREKKMHHERGMNFADYCRDRFGFEKSQAYRLISAAAITQEVSPHGDIPQPTTELQTRELAKAGDVAPEVWAEVVKKHGPDAPAPVIREVISHHIDPQEPAGDVPTGPDTTLLVTVQQAVRRALSGGWSLSEIHQAVTDAPVGVVP